MNKDIKLSVIIPAYNEGDRILPTLESLSDYFSGAIYSVEILIVDDGSTDNTKEVVSSFINENANSNMSLVGYPDNRGKGSAVRYGMLRASGDYSLFVDADGAIDIRHLDLFWDYIQEGNDVVIGSIELPGHVAVDNNQWYRRILGRISKMLIRTTATPGIYDTQRAFKMFSRQAAEEIFERQTILGWGFDIEIIVIARTLGYRIKELPVQWVNPEGSHVGGFADYVETLRELASILWKKMRKRYHRTGVGTLQILREIQTNKHNY